MSCGKFQDLILSGERPPALEEHLASCARCRVFRDACAAMDQTLAATLKSPELPADFAARVRRAIEAGAPPLERRWVPGLLDAIGYGSLALALGLLFQAAPVYGLGASAGGVVLATAWFGMQGQYRIWK